MPRPANDSAPSVVMNPSATNEPRTPTWNIHQPKPTSAAISRNRNTSRERAVSWPPQHRHPQLARPPVAERNAEREGEHDGKPEDPEDRLRLAVELAHPGKGELPQRVITHRAAASR